MNDKKQDLSGTKISTNGSVVKVSKMGKGFGYWRTALTALTFAAGITVTLIFQNVTQGESVQFSTVGLIGFIISVSLSVTAIVAAIAAVSLGYISQREMRERGEDAYRLQSEMFNRNVDLLLKLETQVAAHRS